MQLRLCCQMWLRATFEGSTDVVEWFHAATAQMLLDTMLLSRATSQTIV